MLKQNKSKEYQTFSTSKLEYTATLVRSLRLGLSLLIIIFCISLITSVQPNYKAFYIFTAIVFVSNIAIASVVLKKRTTVWINGYVAVFSTMLASFNLENSFDFASSGEFGSFLGVGTGMFLCLLFISRMPLKVVWISTSLFTAHFLIRLFMSKALPLKNMLNMGLMQGLNYLLFLLIYYKQENLDFNNYLALHRNRESLRGFKRLIKEFPTQLYILTKSYQISRRAIFLNKEAKKLVKTCGSLSTSFERLRLETNIGEMGCELGPTLQSLIEKKIESNKFPLNNIDLNYENCFEVYTAIIDAGSEKSVEMPQKTTDLDELIETKQKFEVKIGTILWDEHQEEMAVIVVISDISKSERIRELKILHENKDQLLATVSHELRTPLNGLIGMLEVMDEKILDKELREVLTVAQNSSQALLFMINDILDISQIRRGKLILHREKVRLLNLIDRVLSLINLQIQKKGLGLVKKFECDLETTVFVDKMRFQQVLLNLLSNALKFTQIGNITVSVSYEPKNFNNLQSPPLRVMDIALPSENTETQNALSNQIFVCVEDTGIGIKPEILPRLFQLFGKFERSGNTTGVGLGLAISQSLVKNMNNSEDLCIKVRSSVGVGSKFWFPVLKEGTMMEDDTEEGKAQQMMDLGEKVFLKPGRRRSKINILQSETNPKRILVVDDDQVNHLVLSKYLQDPTRYVLAKAFDGEEALRIIDDNCKKELYFDLILMDCNMPVMDGFQAMRAIKSRISKGQLPEVKVLALTANVSLADKNECISCGMSDFITKPLRKLEFLLKIDKYLQELGTRERKDK